MKRVLKVFGVVLLVLVVAVGVLGYLSFGGARPLKDGEELPGGGRTVVDGHVSAVVLPLAANEVALVDCGEDPGAKAILKELARRGLGPEAVKLVLLTHGHADHVGGCRTFPKAEILGLAADAALEEGREGSRGPLTRLMGKNETKPIHLTQAITDGSNFERGALHVKAYAIPGHTAGSVAYLIGGTLFLGDSAGATSDGRLTGAVWIFTDDAAQNRASLKALAERLEQEHAEVKAIAFAHTGPLEGLAPLQAFATH